MDDIVTERSEGILRVELNRPEKLNAMTSSMYVTLADVFNNAAKDERIRVVLWHGAGDSFCAGNDMEDFLKKPARAKRISAGAADEGLHRVRQTAGRGRPRCRHRRGNLQADALRLGLRGRERKIPDAFHQS